MNNIQTINPFCMLASAAIRHHLARPSTLAQLAHWADSAPHDWDAAIDAVMSDSSLLFEQIQRGERARQGVAILLEVGHLAVTAVSHQVNEVIRRCNLPADLLPEHFEDPKTAEQYSWYRANQTHGMPGLEPWAVSQLNPAQARQYQELVVSGSDRGVRIRFLFDHAHSLTNVSKYVGHLQKLGRLAHWAAEQGVKTPVLPQRQLEIALAKLRVLARLTNGESQQVLSSIKLVEGLL